LNRFATDKLRKFLDEVAAPCSLSRTFLVHGFAARVRSNSSFVLDAVGELLSYFARPEGEGEVEGRFHLLEKSSGGDELLREARRSGRLLYDSRTARDGDSIRSFGMELRRWACEDVQVLDFGSRGFLAVDSRAGDAAGILRAPAEIHPRILSTFVFLSGFSELLRARETYFVHAAALAKNGKGVLIPGPSGSGKTTLSLTLLRGGFRFLSDDRTILKKSSGTVGMFAFPDGVDATEKTLAFFPELRNAPRHLLKEGTRKKKLAVEGVYPRCVVASCVPSVLVIPHIVDEESSRLEPVGKTEGARHLLPHSLGVIDPESAERHFRLLCDLVEGVDCYRLDFGRDVLEAHRLLDAVV